MVTNAALSAWISPKNVISTTPGSDPERRGMATTAMNTYATRGFIPTDWMYGGIK